MSLPNLEPGDVPEPPEFRAAQIGSEFADFSEEPGFLTKLLEDSRAGLDSFGSEESESAPGAFAATPWDFTGNRVSRNADQPPARPVLAAKPSPATTCEDRVPVPEHLPAAGSDDLPAAVSDARVIRSALLSRIGSFGRIPSSVSSRTLLAPLRWSRAHFNLRVAITVVLTLTGVAEAGWLGVRAARGLSGMMRDGTEWPSATGGDSSSRQTMAGSGSEVLVSVHSTLPATRPQSPKVPGWVSISTPAPVEILERGRVIGASWNGGVRLAPGRHDVRLLNRAGVIDLEQSLDIAPGSTTSVVVEYVPGTLQETACPRGQCESAPSHTTAPR